tara:strand:+ start:3317 stop:3469 length:153 start_codon:yes stop_codon:yes gene_type:complete
MGCGCKGKAKGKQSKRPTNKIITPIPKSNVIKLTETDLKNLINKVIKTTK